MFDKECEPKDGFYKESHNECSNCWWGAKDLCRLNALFVGRVNLSKLVEKKESRDKKLSE